MIRTEFGPANTVVRKNTVIALTVRGDTPALNATIHGAVVRANQFKLEIYGFIKGFNCLFSPQDPHVHLNPLFQAIPELDPTKGGTLIGSSRDYVVPNKETNSISLPRGSRGSVSMD